jgi:hypothetical protein
MRKFAVACGVCLLAAMTFAPKPVAALEDCYVIRATADARNADIARDRAIRRLQTYIGRKLSKQAGKTVSPISTQCIRTACEASAIVCSH